MALERMNYEAALKSAKAQELQAQLTLIEVQSRLANITNQITQ
jgi:hypothetical protein